MGNQDKLYFPWNDFQDKALSEGHSQTYLDSTKSYYQNLRSQNLPIIFSCKHLSLYLGLDNIKELYELVKNRSRYYTYYKIRKRRSGFRYIHVPNSKIKIIQKWIFINILQKVSLNVNCKGFRKNYSIRDNAIDHVNKKYVVNLDIFKCFDSIKIIRVENFFIRLGYTSIVSKLLAKLLFVPATEHYKKFLASEGFINKELINLYFEILPQGACTSPIISNIILTRLDKRLSAYCLKNGFKYSRYADDLTFSGEKIVPINFITSIINEEGFKLNKDKIKIFRENKRQLVTGVVVNKKVKAPKEKHSEVRKHLYYASKYGVQDHLAKCNIKKANFKEWLLGNIHYINSLEPEKGKLLMEKFDKINWGL